MSHYYNEWEPYAAQWLRNLIAAGHLPAGDVDERSITDVALSDLTGYTQCHFFAGIGGWALAARMAGWPDDRELWTGSCPCQPFSVAGKGAGQADERHLWPEQFRLISARRPAVWMGEQVAAAVGKNWFDGVCADLEGIGYACGSAVVPACAVDAPHRRDRLWVVAHTVGERWGQTRCDIASNRQTNCGRSGDWACDAASIGNCEGVMADSLSAGLQKRQGDSKMASGSFSGPEGKTFTDDCKRSAWCDSGWIGGHDGKARRVKPGVRLLANGVQNRVGRLRAYGNAIVPQVAAEVIAAYMDCAP